MWRIIFLILSFRTLWITCGPITTTDNELIISFVETEAAKLTDDSLSDDILLEQSLIRGNTFYRHQRGEKHGALVFKRIGSDEGKAVVVLPEGQDFLNVCGQKKTFVVLRQTKLDKMAYRILFAYVKQNGATNTIEWDAWFPRGNDRNKAMSFGFVKCTKSNMVPCKAEMQLSQDVSPDYEDFSEGSNPTMEPIPIKPGTPGLKLKEGTDYYCDMAEGVDQMQSRFVGAVISALTQSTAVLYGAEVIYNENTNILAEIHSQITRDIPEAATKGASEAAANETVKQISKKLLDHGKEALAGGTLMFYAAVVKVGSLAMGETPPNELKTTPVLNTLNEKNYKIVGASILRGLFKGANTLDVEQKLTNPNPMILLDDGVAANLIAGKSVGSAMEEHQATGRGILGWLTGTADIGTQWSNGENATRTYQGVQKDGTDSGSKGVDNLSFAIDNTFGNAGKKSAGQVFSENLVAGVYMPYGLIDDLGDGLSGAVLGSGRVSNDRAYADDLLDKAMNGVAGVAGRVVDVVGDILAPVGLGGLWTGIAGFSAGVLGAIGGGLASPVLGVHTLIKMGAKAIGVEGLIGMHGAESREANSNGNQNVDRYSKGSNPLPPNLAAALSNATVVLSLPPPNRRKKRQSGMELDGISTIVATTDVDLFSHIGWRTMELSQDKLHNGAPIQTEPFIGFGNCVLKPPTLKEIESSKSSREIAKLYMQALRTHCLKDQFEKDLFTGGYLKLNSDNTFKVPESLPILTKSKLSYQEISDLSKAFEMSIFSQTYMSALKTPLNLSPGTSQSATFLKSFVTTFLEESKKLAPLHNVKLTRNLAKLTKTALVKTLQDFYRMKNCMKCDPSQIKEYLKDSILILGLLNFIIVDQERPEYMEGSKEVSFHKYFTANSEAVGKQIQMYLL